MSNDTLVKSTTLTAIADAIREKTETTDAMYPSEMAGKILAIEGASEGQFVWKKSEPCLVSSGTQYINLDVKPNQNTKAEVDFEALSGSSNDPTLFGAWDSAISNSFLFIVSKSLGSCLSFYGSNYTEHALDMTGRHTAVVDKNVTSVDGNTVITLASATFSSNYPMYLFAYNNGGTAGNIPSAIKIYSCKVYDNGSLVRDVIPYVDGNGVACMYDKVSESCLYNAGSGVFAVGGADDFVYVADDDENKYPDGGIVDGYYYERVEIDGGGIPDTIVAGNTIVDLLKINKPVIASFEGEVVGLSVKTAGTYRAVFCSDNIYDKGVYLYKNGTSVGTFVTTDIQDSGWKYVDVTCNAKDRLSVYVENGSDPSVFHMFAFGLAIDWDVSGLFTYVSLVSEKASFVTTSTSMKASGIYVDIPVDGIYKVDFTAERNSTSGTWVAQLYRNGSAISDAVATWSSKSGVYSGYLTCLAGDRLEIYGRSRGTSYELTINELTAEEQPRQ